MRFDWEGIYFFIAFSFCPPNSSSVDFTVECTSIGNVISKILTMMLVFNVKIVCHGVCLYTRISYLVTCM